MRALWLAALVALSGCGSSDGAASGKPLDIPAGCNPLASEWSCLLPFPSDQYLVPDATLPSGKRVALTDEVRPVTKDGKAIDPTLLHPADGFSPGSQILAFFPAGIDDSNLVPLYGGDLEKSLAADNTTVLLDADTGQRVLHCAETDPRADSNDDRGLVIRPLVRLADAHRYIVAIRGLKDATGAPLAPPEGFRRIRDRKTAGDPVLGPLRARYEKQIFPKLAAAGIARDDLLLAWDFTTRTEENATRDMLTVRDDVMQALAAKPPSYQIISQKDAPDTPSSHIWRELEVSVSVPLYLEKDAPLEKLHRDASGKVTANGSVDVPFTVIIPTSVGTRPAGSPPARLLEFGHGFFGSRSEVEGFPAETADAKGFVVVAANWEGMSDEDRIQVTNTMLGDPSNTMVFTDRLHQAMANFIAVGAVAQGALASAPELQTPAGPAYDPSALYFYGLSMGHILGSSYVALSPSIERTVLGVGGNDFSFIMFRSQPFQVFLLLMSEILPSKLDQLEMSFMLQLSFDRVDPLTYAPHLLSNTLPGSPPSRHALLQIGIGDSAVNPSAAHLQARTLGIKHMTPAPRTIAGLDDVTGPFDGSAIEEFDFHIDPQPGVQAIPPVGSNPVHEGVRQLAAAQEQLNRFLKPGGKIEQTCDGPCDPE